MSNVALLLDKARERRSIGSDNALAVRLGKSRQTVSQWRSGVRHPEDDDVLALCALAGEDCAVWLVAVQAERAHGAAAKAWSALAKRLGAAAALVVAAALLPAFPAHAERTMENRHYAKCRRIILRKILTKIHSKRSTGSGEAFSYGPSPLLA